MVDKSQKGEQEGFRLVMSRIDASNRSVVITVRVIARSSKTEIVGEHAGALKIKLKSPPVDGAANDELIRFLSKLFEIPRTNIEIISGLTSKTKHVRLSGSRTHAIERFLQGKS